MNLKQVKIRRGTLADVAVLRGIECEVFDLEQLTGRAFRRYLGLAGADVVVAVPNGDPVGYAIASYRGGSANGRLISIAVATRGTGRGIGTRLLADLHERARLRGMDRMRLEVRRDNQAALNLYARAGYRQIGIKSAYYADFCDAIVMDRRL